MEQDDLDEPDDGSTKLDSSDEPSPGPWAKTSAGDDADADDQD